jgi:hypothetical protein
MIRVQMPRALAMAAFLLLANAYAAPLLRAAPPQQVVDRIVVRIENDIITLSEMRELAAYQQIVDGKAEPDDRLLSELIEQWVVNAEATAAQFPAPADSEVDREVAQVESHFSNPQPSASGASSQIARPNL